MTASHIGLVGLGTMGANLARNAARNGATVAVYNRTTEKTDTFMATHGSEGKFVSCKTIPDLVAALPAPRSIILMVNAGAPVDAVIQELLPHLQADDAIIDAGNSHFTDTERRIAELKTHGVHLLGMGVSGGEEGALNGPSMMPGGSKDAFDRLEPLLKKMAAKDGSGGKCVSFIGSGGSGHFVKMVHNGIEYALMQLIAESYDILKHIGGFSNQQLAETFSAWNETAALSSFLLEITAKIFTKKDEVTGGDLIDVIKDSAKQKGTGKWTTEAALELCEPTPTIDASVIARNLSGDPRRSMRDLQKLPRELKKQTTKFEATSLQHRVRSALECSILCAYNQGFHLIERASTAHDWGCPMDEIVRIWRGGCIIRMALLKKFQRACSTDPAISTPAEAEILGRFAGKRQRDWRRVVGLASAYGIPIPAMAASLSYYDTICAAHLPQNLTQAQRDFFGAHTFERLDKSGTFHANWN